MMHPLTANPDPNRPLTPQASLEITRDQAWLETQLITIWQNHFHDVPQANTVVIKWGRASRTRLGVITGKGGPNPRHQPTVSEIRINPLLQHLDVPEHVIWQTIAHELAHYAHGFCSPHPQKYANPHQGRVVERELIARNLGTIYLDSQRWLRANWQNHVTQSLGKKTLRRSIHARRFKLSLLPHRRPSTSRRSSLGR